MIFSTVTFKGKLDNDMLFTGVASWLNVDDMETRDYKDEPIEFVVGELLDAGQFVITIEKID